MTTFLPRIPAKSVLFGGQIWDFGSSQFHGLMTSHFSSESEIRQKLENRAMSIAHWIFPGGAFE